ncbi:MAG: putative PEP-binding protein, partial [Candidatus Diapherotrites archaeon]
GIATGKVKIVPTASHIEKIKEGDILVTKMTNPDWVPVMKKAAGIITDEGGTTCHAAIVSRELGIPCIVGAGDATRKLHDNQVVTLNGYNGFVYEGEVEIKVEKKTEEKIIRLEDVDRLENAIKIEIKKQPKIPKPVRLKPMVSEAKPGIMGIATLIKDERKMKDKIREQIAEFRATEKEKEEAEKALETKERDEEEAEKLAGEPEAKEVVQEFGEKKAEDMNESDYEKESMELRELLEKISAKVKVNVALPEAAEKAAATGADGVGLLRAEHMITAAGVHPAEYLRMGQVAMLARAVRDGIEVVLKQFKGKPVWYRTFDARTDEYRNLKGGEKEPGEENPMIGWHGIRRDLDEPELLRAQFIAIKQLIDKGYTNIGIMLPFVISELEVRKAKEIAKEIGLERKKGVLEFGVMVETPASVWIIDELIDEGIDFISFGTNDLTQLTLGIDRNNERIQKGFSEMHPAILRSLKRVIEKCRAAGVTTSICGQAASDPEMVSKLIRYGIDSLSANIDAVEHIKHVVLVEEKKMILEGLKGKEKKC